MMNSFLINSWLILLCSVPTVQFCIQSFPVYARFTEVDLLFGNQVEYLQVFKIFWDYNIFTIAMLSVAGVTLLTLLVCAVLSIDSFILPLVFCIETLSC